MSRSRKVAAEGRDVTSPGVAALVNGNSPWATEAPVLMAPGIAKNGTTGAIDGQGKLATASTVSGETAASITRTDQLNALVAERDAVKIELADAHRLLAEVKAQRNAHADEIMLLRAQLKIAVEDGNNGWAAAAAARGQPH